MNLSLRKLSLTESCDDFLIAHEAPLTQSLMYATWHMTLGRTLHRYVVEMVESAATHQQSVKQIAYIQAIEVPLFLGKKYLYAPYGPVIDTRYTHLALPFIKKEFVNIAKGIGASFFRLDISPTISDATPLLQKTFFKASKKTYKGSFFQPRAEWALDVRPPSDQLLANIHSKTRYCIRTAEKRNCGVNIISDNLQMQFATFAALMKETATRNGFNLHDEAYYKAIFANLDDTKRGFLVTTTVSDVITNCMLFVKFGSTVMYIFGGSTTDQYNVPAAHLALWHAIQHAKSVGATTFNFGGISTDEYPNPSLANLTQFKTRFGGYNLRHSRFYDLVIDRLTYALFVLRKLF